MRAIHHQHTGSHAPDHQLVELGQVGKLFAALLGERLALVHLLAQLLAQQGGGHVCHRKHHRLGDGAVFGAEQSAENIFGEKHAGSGDREPDAGGCGKNQAAGGHVEYEEHRDAAFAALGGDQCPGRGHDVDGEADGRLPAQAMFGVATGDEQRRRGQQVNDGYALRQHRIRDINDARSERSQHGERHQAGFQHPEQREEIQLLALHRHARAGWQEAGHAGP